MKSSAGALRSDASSTIFSMRATALSLSGRVTFIRATLSVAIMPASTSWPFSMVRGMLSPVSAAVLKAASPLVSMPSSGTRSPGLTSMISPGMTFSGLSATL